MPNVSDEMSRENVVSFAHDMSGAALRWGVENHNDGRLEDGADSLIATIMSGCMIIEAVGSNKRNPIPLELYQQLVQGALNLALEDFGLKVIVEGGS